MKNKLISRLHSTGGVQKLIDPIAIGPVTPGNDFILKQKVDSVLATYASISSDVKNVVVVLNGIVKKKESGKMIVSVGKLQGYWHRK